MQAKSTSKSHRVKGIKSILADELPADQSIPAFSESSEETRRLS